MATTATRGRSGPSWAGVCGTGPAATRTTGWNRITAVSRAATGPCGVSSAPDRPPGSAGLTTSSATSSAPAPATTSTSPPTAVDCSCSAGPRPCWPSSKRPDRPSPQVQRQAPYSLARGLTEPATWLRRAGPPKAEIRRTLERRYPMDPALVKTAMDVWQGLVLDKEPALLAERAGEVILVKDVIGNLHAFTPID